ncbi:hypothetical protein FRB90_009133 [Tulasnella sp. 427]|nr:hypothetical protein FRB90_009133 [Tulasnella sp. 427]
MVPFIIHLIQRFPRLSITVLAWNESLSDFRDGAKRANIPLDGNPQLRLIGIAESTDVQPLEEYSAFGDAFTHAYGTIINGGTLACSDSSQEYQFASLPDPSLVIGATFIPKLARTVKDQSKSTKYLVFVPSTASGFLRQFGPDDLGGLGSWEEDTKAKMSSGHFPGLTTEAAARAVEYQFTRRLMPRVDGASMYDYELYPQDVAPASIVDWLWQETRQVTASSAADGVILITTPSFEPETTAALRSWYSDQLGKELFLVGPQVYPSWIDSTTTDETPAPVKPGSTGVILPFLKAHPKGSVWCISFGTTYFPYNRMDYFRTVIKTLIGLDIPVLLTCGWSDTVPNEAIPTELASEMRVRNKGLIVDWIHDQDTVLCHPSIGVFLSGGGLNSMWEAVIAGVLCVYWPFAVDQPLNAAYLTIKVGLVRTGPGADRPARGGEIEGTNEAVAAEVGEIVRDISSEIGDRKRQNLTMLRERVLGAIEEGGESYMEIDRLIAYSSSTN